MGINREKHKKSCSYFLELLSVEPNNLVVSWGKNCDNSLATSVGGEGGKYCLEIAIMPPNYLFLSILLCYPCFLFITLCTIPKIPL